MKIGATRTDSDVRRELQNLDAVKYIADYRLCAYNTPVSTTSTTFSRLGGAFFNVETEPGDTVDIEYFVPFSTGSGGGIVRTRIVREDVITVGRERRATSVVGTSSGQDSTLHGRVREMPPKGVNSYLLEWALVSGGTGFSLGAEIFITVYR